MTVNATLLVGQDPNDRRSFIAHTAVEAHRLVTLRTADPRRVEYPAAQFDFAVGVTLHAAAAGETVEVAFGGFALLKVDGNASNIAVGDSITTHDATGFGQKVAGGAAARRPCVGFAMSASTADDDLISVEITKHSVYFAS
jgi:hypothetical protein